MNLNYLFCIYFNIYIFKIFIQERQENEGLKILEFALKRPNLIKSLAGVFVPCQTRPPYFLKMYKYLVDSHLKLCDTKILFVLFSKVKNFISKYVLQAVMCSFLCS